MITMCLKLMVVRVKDKGKGDSVLLPASALKWFLIPYTYLLSDMHIFSTIKTSLWAADTLWIVSPSIATSSLSTSQQYAGIVIACTCTNRVQSMVMRHHSKPDYNLGAALTVFYVTPTDTLTRCTLQCTVST